MSDNAAVAERSELDAFLTGIMGELEDQQVKLMHRQAALLEQLDDINAELERIDRLRAAALHRPRSTPEPSKRKRYGIQGMRTANNKRAVLDYAKKHREFKAGDVAAQMGRTPQGVGAVISGLLSDGQLSVVRREHKTNVYALAQGRL